MRDKARPPAARPLRCKTRTAKGCVPEDGEEAVATPDRGHLPSGTQHASSWKDPAGHVPVSSAFSLSASVCCYAMYSFYATLDPSSDVLDWRHAVLILISKHVRERMTEQNMCMIDPVQGGLFDW